MKPIHLLTLLLVFSVAFASCKKEDQTITPTGEYYLEINDTIISTLDNAVHTNCYHMSKQAGGCTHDLIEFTNGEYSILVDAYERLSKDFTLPNMLERVLGDCPQSFYFPAMEIYLTTPDGVVYQNTGGNAVFDLNTDTAKLEFATTMRNMSNGNDSLYVKGKIYCAN